MESSSRVLNGALLRECGADAREPQTGEVAATPSDEGAVAMLELAPRTAGTERIALDLAPGRGIVRIRGNIPGPLDGHAGRARPVGRRRHLVLARQRIDMRGLHLCRLGQNRRRLLYAHMEQLAHDV